MSISRVFICILFFCGALGLTTSPAQGRLHCYKCSFAKPCIPVPVECQEDEICVISTGTSEQKETIERKGCLPRIQCSLPGQVTYWSRTYDLKHSCCEQDLCNSGTKLQGLSNPLLPTLLPLLASFPWGGRLFY